MRFWTAETLYASQRVAPVPDCTKKVPFPMTDGELDFTLWDVGHGVSIWINTPNGSSHLDRPRANAGLLAQPACPARSWRNRDRLSVHQPPDKDHLEDLPQFKASFGDPKTLYRNKSLPDADMFGQRSFEYQEDFADLHGRFTQYVPHVDSPTNPDRNGGVRYVVHSLDHGTLANSPSLLERIPIKGNNTSVVIMLLYQGVLFACLGDIEPPGWGEIWRRHAASYRELIHDARLRFLVAPHHGRKSGYCKSMMDAIQPHATFVSDVWGESETHPAFRRDPLGVRYPSGDTVRYYTTKRAGRVQVTVSATRVDIRQHDR